MNPMKNIILETDIGADPDDLFALLYLLSRDDVSVKAITCTPGRKSQIRLLSAILQFCDREDIPISIPRQKIIEEKHVNDYHWYLLSKIGFNDINTDTENYSNGGDLIASLVKTYPDILLITIGPLTNIKQALLSDPSLLIQKSFTMGGFISENEKGQPFPSNLKCMEYCQTFNLSGDRSAARIFIETSSIKEKYFIFKNITHLCVVPLSFINTLKLNKGFNSSAHKLFALALSVYFENHNKKIFMTR